MCGEIMDLKFTACLKLLEIATGKSQGDTLFETLVHCLPEQRVSYGLDKWNNKTTRIVLLVYLILSK